MATQTYDLIVIGGGSTGENAAGYAVDESYKTLKVAMIERELVGGECSYWACMPSKSLLQPVSVVNQSASVQGIKKASLDVEALLKRRDKFTHNHSDVSQVKWAEGAGITVIRGEARLDGEKKVVVSQGGQDIRLLANHAVVLAAGTTAFIPPIEGLREALPWTSRDATNVAEVPERLVILGGGVVACESATWMAALGSEVTLVARSLLLPKNEPFAGELVARNLQKAGVKVLLRTSAESVSRQDPAASGEGRVHGGKVTVSIEGQDDIMADEIIVAAGRSPATAGLNLESVGLKSGGYVQADDRLTAQGDWLYAAGDINGKALLTHMGKYQGRLCGAIIAARAAGRSLDSNRFKILAPLAVPQVTFTDPEVASVGLTRREAQEQGFQVEDFEYDLAWIAGSSLLRDDYLGRASMIVDANTNCLLGVTFVGTGVAELVHSATVAIVARVPLDVLWHAVPSYPTVSEIWLRLLEAWNAKHFQTS